MLSNVSEPTCMVAHSEAEPQADPVARWVSTHLRELNAHRGKVLVLHPARGILANCVSWDEALAAGPSLSNDGEAVLWPVRDDWTAA